MDNYTFIVADDLKELSGDITIDGTFSGIKVFSKISPKGAKGCC